MSTQRGSICYTGVPDSRYALSTPHDWRQDLGECALLDGLSAVCQRCLFVAGDSWTPIPGVVVAAGLCGAYCSRALGPVLQLIVADGLADLEPFERLRLLHRRHQSHAVRCVETATLGLTLIVQLLLYARLGDMAMKLASHTDGLATNFGIDLGVGLAEGVDGAAVSALSPACSSARRRLSLLDDLDHFAPAACVPGRLLRELVAAGELFGDLFTALHWVPLPVALGLAMATRLVALGYGSLAGKTEPLHSTPAEDLLLEWARAADFVRSWMLWPGPHGCRSVGDVLSLLESLVPGEPGQLGGIPLCAGFQCALCLNAIGDFGALARAPRPVLKRWLHVASMSVRAPRPPAWAHGLWGLLIAALDVICAFSEGTIAGWLHGGSTGWGDDIWRSLRRGWATAIFDCSGSLKRSTRSPAPRPSPSRRREHVTQRTAFPAGNSLRSRRQAVFPTLAVLLKTNAPSELPSAATGMRSLRPTGQPRLSDSGCLTRQ